MTNKARSENTIGEIVNLFVDMAQFKHYIAYFFWNWEMPLNLVRLLVYFVLVFFTFSLNDYL